MGYSLTTTTGNRQSTLMMELPYYSIDGKTPENKIKDRNLFANILHSVDSRGLRDIGQRAMDEGFVMMFKHDDFLCHPNHADKIIEWFRDTHVEEYNTNGFIDAMHQIKDNLKNEYVRENLTIPEMLMGNATLEDFKDADRMLAS